MVDLHEQVKRGEVTKLTLEQKKQLFVLKNSLTTVYFIAAPDANMIKIGKTTDLKKRFATLRTMSPIPIQIATHIEYDDRLEYRIHQHLKEHRSHGEWFHATKEVVDFMRGYRDHGIHWVMEQVGDCVDSWIDHKGIAPELKDEFRGGSGVNDPDYAPGSQDKSGIDHTAA